MALNTVTLTWDLTDFLQAGQQGVLTLVPTTQLTDATDGLIIPETGHSVTFTGAGSLPGVIATDNAQVLPAGWAYQVSVTTTTGQVIVAPQQIYVAYAKGATQGLAGLIAP